MLIILRDLLSRTEEIMYLEPRVALLKKKARLFLAGHWKKLQIISHGVFRFVQTA